MKRLLILTLVLSAFHAGYPAENSTLYYKKGVEEYRAGNFTGAEKSFIRAIELNPYYTLGHYGLGRVYLKQKGGSADSIKHLKKSVSLDPSFAKGWFKLGIAEFLAEKYIESLHSFSEAYKRDRTFIEALYNIGVVYDLLGDNYRAYVHFRLYYKRLKGERESPF